MKRVFVVFFCVFQFIWLNKLNAQTIHLSEDFNTPGCLTGCSVNGYNGWVVNTLGLNGNFANEWFRSCAENGNTTGTCGSGCGNDATLHIGNVIGSPSSLLCPTGDCGAAYDAGFFTGEVVTDKRAETPFINLICSGNLVKISFKYMERGQGTTDNFTLDYFDGITWTQIDDPAKTLNNCLGQGRWTLYSFNLPASAVGNPNVKIGFHWINNDDAAGSDPSVAVDSIRITSNAISNLSASFLCNTNLCVNDCINFNDQSIGNIASWSWDFGGGGNPLTSVVQSPFGVCWNTVGTFDVTLTVTDNCGISSSQVQQITVSNCSNLLADFTTPVTNICTSTCIDFTDLSTPVGTIIGWNWSFIGGTPSSSIQQNPTNICYNTPGTYDVKLTIDDGTNINTLILPGYIVVSNCTPLTADFTTPITNICTSTCIDFTDLSTPIGTIIGWNWSFIGGTPSSSIQQNPTNICYNTPGTYDVKLTIDDGTNINTLILPGYIVVSNCAPLTADFTTPITNFCSSTCIDFTDLSTPNGSIINWNWSFPGATPNSSVLSNPIGICYNTPGVYDVILTVDDGANNNSFNIPGYITVTSCQTPVAGFNANLTNLCLGQCTNFSDQSQNSTAWIWGFPGGTPNLFIGQNPPQICYSTAGVYDVAQYVTDANGNTDTLIQVGYITVTNCLPNAGFSSGITTGCNGDCFNFSDLSTGATAWDWLFPGGTPSSFSGQNPPAICYNNPGVYDVSLIVTNANGSDTLVQFGYITITYCNGLLAQFSASDTDICEGDCISFMDQSFGTPIGWLWVLPGAVPDTLTAQNPPFVCYPNAGNYPVILYAFNTGGIDSIIYTNYITVRSGSLVSTNIDSVTIYAGQSIQLIASGGVNYLWYPDIALSADTISSPIASPTDTTIYQVVMTDANGCSSTKSVIVNVIPPESVWAPTAFTPNNDQVNDIFKIHPIGIINKYVLKIFDRWGEMVFTSNDQNDGWDGTYQSVKLNVGVYIYYYYIEFIDGVVIENSGDVTLLK